MSVRVCAALVPLLLVSSGCFVFDELDSGSAIMDQHSPRSRNQTKPESQPEQSVDLAQKGRDALRHAERWWDDLGRPEPEKDDSVVRCLINGEVQYTRRSTCRSSVGTEVSR